MSEGTISESIIISDIVSHLDSVISRLIAGVRSCKVLHFKAKVHIYQAATPEQKKNSNRMSYSLVNEGYISEPSIIRDVVFHLATFNFCVIVGDTIWKVAHLKSKVHVYQAVAPEYMQNIL